MAIARQLKLDSQRLTSDTFRMTRTRPWRLLLLLALLSLLLTWPLLPNIFTHVPGDGIDDPALAWNLWWAKYSWVDRAGVEGLIHNPFDGDSMFYPISINLAFYTLSLLNGALSIPLQSAVSLILTSNLILLSSFIIGGFGAYLLTLELLASNHGAHPQRQRQAKGNVLTPSTSSGHRSDLRPLTSVSRPPTSDFRLAALITALIYAFASAKLFYVALGQFNIASSQWLPFVAFYLARSFQSPWRWRNGMMMGLFLLFQTWAELTYGTFAVLLIGLTVIGTVLMAFYRARYRPAAWRVFRAAAIAAVMFVIGLLPYLANMLPDMLANAEFLVEGGGFSDIFSVDLLGFLLPTQLHPLFGDIIRNLADNSRVSADGSQFMVNKGQHLYLGFSVMVLAGYGIWVHHRKLWVWAIALLTGFFLLVSLGPALRIAGYETEIPGLFPLLLKIPFFQANRYPSRYSIVILLGAGVLAALGVLALFRHVRPTRRKWLVAALAAIVLFEHVSAPLPLSDFRLPPAYDAVVADDRPGAVLDLPIGWRNGFNVFGKADTIIMYTQWYQAAHAKPRLGGNTSRNPEQKFQYFMEHPVIGVLAALQDGRDVPPDDFARAQALAPDLLRIYNIHIVTLHKDKVPHGFEEKLLELFPLHKMEEQGGVARYEGRWPEERNRVDLLPDAPELQTYLDQGWGVVSQLGDRSAVWATRADPTLILPATTRPALVELSLFSPGDQTLTFSLDGRILPPCHLVFDINSCALSLPPSADGFPQRLAIHSDNDFVPSDVPFASGIVVRSAGKDSGDFAHIFVDGIDFSPNQRGYNLVALDGTASQVLSAAVFDTHDPTLDGESARMAAWIDALPVGTTLAGAVRDAAALNLQQEAIDALSSIGVQSDIRGHTRRAHAFVGVKSAQPGSAKDFTSDLWPVTVTLGDGITEADPTFALVELTWQLQPE